MRRLTASEGLSVLEAGKAKEHSVPGNGRRLLSLGVFSVTIYPTSTTLNTYAAPTCQHSQWGGYHGSQSFTTVR